MVLLRLACSTFWVDVRLREINARWIASADTPDGPSLGLGKGAIEAIEHALEPFVGIVNELLVSLPLRDLARSPSQLSVASVAWLTAIGQSG